MKAPELFVVGAVNEKAASPTYLLGIVKAPKVAGGADVAAL